MLQTLSIFLRTIFNVVFLSLYQTLSNDFSMLKNSVDDIDVRFTDGKALPKTELGINDEGIVERKDTKRSSRIFLNNLQRPSGKNLSDNYSEVRCSYWTWE